MTKTARDTKTIEKIKEAIIAKAVDIINAEGFTRMTMRKIASKNSMSATNLYNYFSNKDEIYINILIRGFRSLYEQLKSVYDENDDPLTRGKKFIMTYLTFGIQNYNYYEIMFSPALPKYNDYVGTPLEDLAGIEMDYSKKIIELSVAAVGDVLKKQKRIDAAETERRMIEIWSMLHGMISLYNSRMIDYVIIKPVDTYERIVDDLLGYIKS
ncbi:MAG TPA: TetR/AcrR family transcriptional regulator [Spirochaetota bacterium]|jgi:AcrR family transcriptional regulator|nr:TetR/AcrR family transcriptional regulator [Spirochaetota bacterium]HPV41174.1 TetR/AcrR family transcriptional regulator [Spirochaetota bacterium]